MNDKSKRIIAGISAGAILATMAGCSNNSQKDKVDEESTTVLESSTQERTTEDELTKIFEE